MPVGTGDFEGQTRGKGTYEITDEVAGVVGASGVTNGT
ncbi:MAG: YjbQ family protein, partial [Akkermansiaceae bacterium]|nr:YjbQ family protein [Akkermansiaceae bacterium]